MLNRTPYEILNLEPPQLQYVDKYKYTDAAEAKCLALASDFYPPQSQDDEDALDEYFDAYFAIRKQMKRYEMSKKDMDKELAKFKWESYIKIISDERHRKIKEFNDEVDKIKQLNIPHSAEQKEEFINQLLNLKSEIAENLSIQIYSLRTRIIRKCEDILDANNTLDAIRNSDAMTVLKDTTTTLKNMEYSDDKFYKNAQGLEALQSDYEIKSENSPNGKNFVRALSAVVMAGIGFIAGSLLTGIGWTILSVIGGVAPIVFLPVAMTIAGVETAKLSYNLAGVPEGTLKHGLTGQTPIYSAAIKATQTGQQFFNPPKPKPKEVKTAENDFMKVMLSTHR